jgi:hypothetical protein
MRYRYWSTSEIERPLESHDVEPDDPENVVDQFNEDACLSQREDTTVATPEEEAGCYVTVLQAPVTGAPKWLAEDRDSEDSELEDLQDSIRNVLSLESSGATEEERQSWETFFAVAALPAMERCEKHGVPFDLELLQSKSRRNLAVCSSTVEGKTERNWDTITDSNWRPAQRRVAILRAEVEEADALVRVEGPPVMTKGTFCFVRVKPAGEDRLKGVSKEEDACRVALCEVAKDLAEEGESGMITVRWWRQMEGDINGVFVPGFLPGKGRSHSAWIAPWSQELFLLHKVEVKPSKRKRGGMKVLPESLQRLCLKENSGFNWNRQRRRAEPIPEEIDTSAGFSQANSVGESQV